MAGHSTKTNTRSWAKFVALALAILLPAAPALAWEFSMKGEYENRFLYWGSAGNDDLFGHRSSQDSGQTNAVLIGMAGPNIYGRAPGGGLFSAVSMPSSNLLVNIDSVVNQMAIVRGGFSESGSDALINDSRLTLRPTIRVNKAIRVFGVYNIGGYRNKYNMQSTGNLIQPLERYYMQQSSTNAYDTAAVGSWEQFRATIYIPWGIFSVGVKDFPLGTGATLGYNTRAESFLTVVPYGPFRFLYAIWLGRSRGVEVWNTDVDGTMKNDFFQGFIFTYENRHVNIGGGSILRLFHGNAASPRTNNRDDNTWINLAYFKYDNGRLFANAEYAWINVDRYRDVSMATTEEESLTAGRGTGGQTLYLEAYHFFSEGGILAGPVKLTGMFAIASGPVLNNQNRARNLFGGNLNNLNPADDGSDIPLPAVARGNPKVYAAWPINWQALEPYEYLMFNVYGGGNNGGWNILDVSFVVDDHGMMADAYAFAGRVDYALAANLNIWGSYIWAHRLETAGTYFGQYTSDGTLCYDPFRSTANGLGGGTTTAQAFYENAGRVWGVGADYVSNGFIGYEFGAGLDWKLLEGFTLKTRYSYWQPGDWYKEAYQATILDGNGDIVRRAVLRTRDAIHAFQGSMVIDF